MKSKAILSLLAVIIIVVGGYFVYDRNNKQAKAPVVDTPAQEELNGQNQAAATPTPEQATTSPAPAAAKKPAATETTQGTYSDGSEAEGMAPDILVTEIVYDGSTFSPASVDIKVGDIVVFRNKGTSSFWPASAPHPTHTNYPEFDAGKAIASGGKWQFQFGKTGSWKYHDHLNPNATGVVNVTAR